MYRKLRRQGLLAGACREDSDAPQAGVGIGQAHSFGSAFPGISVTLLRGWALSSREVTMRQVVRTAVTIFTALAALAAPEIRLAAQSSGNPYHVRPPWDSLQGRKIGVASGILIDPDGRHMW